MPRGKPKAATNNKGQLNKMYAVGKALGKLGRKAKPNEIHDFVKSKYGAEMSSGMISNYKSILLKKGAGWKAKKAGRKAGPSRTVRAAGAITLDHIKTIKELAETIGAEKVRQLALVLAK